MLTTVRFNLSANSTNEGTAEGWAKPGRAGKAKAPTPRASAKIIPFEQTSDLDTEAISFASQSGAPRRTAGTAGSGNLS